MCNLMVCFPRVLSCSYNLKTLKKSRRDQPFSEDTEIDRNASTQRDRKYCR